MTFTRAETLELEFGIAMSQPMTTGEQSELRSAYGEAMSHLHTIKHSDAWEDMGDICFGDHDHSSQDYLHLWDIQEMYYDMNAFEADVNAQKYLATAGDDPVLTIDVTTQGQNYSTGDSVLGKIYIPRNLARRLNGDTATCKLSYNGCETARNACGIRMPWRCIYVYP